MLKSWNFFLSVMNHDCVPLKKIFRSGQTNYGGESNYWQNSSQKELVVIVAKYELTNTLRWPYRFLGKHYIPRKKPIADS